MGLSLRDRACGCAAEPVEQGSTAHTALGRKTERPHEGEVACAKVGLSLRDRACGYAAVPVEQGSKAHTALGQKAERPHEGAFLLFGGEGGIRTHERLQTFAGFQDQCIQPLCHLSELSCAPGWDGFAAFGDSPLRGALRAS